MKKTVLSILALSLIFSLFAACGKGGENKEADLNAFWTQLETDIEMPPMIDPAGISFGDYYPGLEDIALKQSVVKIPMMSSVVSEFVFLECETEEDAAKAAEILQTRVNTQAEGGAWYPASMEAWAEAKVVTHGSYVAMIAAAENTETVVKSFNALFA